MATPQEIVAAAQAYITAVEALDAARESYENKETIVSSLIQDEQQAMFDAQAAFAAAAQQLELARTTARASVAGWAEAFAAHEAATLVEASARAELVAVSAPEPV